MSAYGKAVGRVRKAGFDFVEIHGAHGIKTLPADTVVMCLGTTPDDGIVNELSLVTLVHVSDYFPAFFFLASNEKIDKSVE